MERLKSPFKPFMKYWQNRPLSEQSSGNDATVIHAGTTEIHAAARKPTYYVILFD
jgi:hypothetical protein